MPVPIPADPPVVLVVDDEALIRNVLLRALSANYRVIAVSNATEALRVLEEHRIDFMMTDVNMPGGSGIDLARQVQAIHPNVGVAFLAAVVDEPTQTRIEDLGATLFIKPFDVQELLSMLALMVPGSTEG